TLYAIDQFVLRGGRAFIFVDPLAEIASAAMPPSGFGMTNGSNLERLFEAWGVEFSADSVVADDVNALSVNTGFGTRAVRHLGLIGVDVTGLDQEDVITSGLESLNIGTAGRFKSADDNGAALEPLVTSSERASLMPAARFQL